jgi:fatty acid desaturase
MAAQATEIPAQAASRADINRLHEFKHWPAWRLWPLVIAALALTQAASVVHSHNWPLLFLICPALGALLFVFVIAFHDASHDRLHPVHWMNEAFGHVVGTLMFVPMEVYRYAHARHHAYLGRQADPELWPFNTPTAPRLLRVLAALCETCFGFIYSPLLFLRGVLVGELTSQERRLIFRGYVYCIVAWAMIIGVVDYTGDWELLLVAGVVPMAISGMLQTLNKFTQHLGLHGHTVLGLTRTVIDEHPAGTVVSSTIFFNDYHGTHPPYAKIPYYNLPSATPYTVANAREFCPVYPHLGSAFVAMLPCLGNPKVGPQWIESNDDSACEETVRESAELLETVAT